MMADDFWTHSRALGSSLKENWDIIIGILTAIGYALVRLKKMLFSRYVTNDQLDILRQDVFDKMELLDDKIEKVSEKNTERILSVLTKKSESE